MLRKSTLILFLLIVTAALSLLIASQLPNIVRSKTAFTEASLDLALTPIAQNAEWTPIERNVDGVTMVLVPVGCFTMGSDEGYNEEKPEYKQCFDKPFWIDKYEVTNAQFTALHGVAARKSQSQKPDYPRDQINWFEAKDFCALRGGRLPTEREWEYAARGPGNRTYPWGNEWDGNRVVWFDNANNRTASVGSHSGGESWVGAVDMSGNLSEWVSTVFAIDADQSYSFEAQETVYHYPYVANDGREADSLSTTFIRVTRGSSWFDDNAYYFRTTMRLGYPPSVTANFIGFRCVQSVDQSK